MRTIVAGNWKMNTDRASAAALIDALVRESARFGAGAEAIIAPPFPFLAMAVEKCQGTPIRVAAQNCHQKEKGACTGEVSAAMLAEYGCRYVIVGHSERRAYHAESDQLVADKAKDYVVTPGIRPVENRPSDDQKRVVTVEQAFADGANYIVGMAMSLFFLMG